MLARVVYPVFRRVDFRGKGRLRRVLPVPDRGSVVAGFPGGMQLQLDLRESLQRDFLFGLYDRVELGLMREWLRDGGGFVDVGAHIGMYSVAASLALGERGRVLAFEPNPGARAQLETNLALNACENVVVSAAAISDAIGESELHVPATPDPSFSSLEAGRFVEGEPVRVETTTVDRAVAEHGVRPAVVKIDVEGGELAVVAGMEETLELRPTLLVEVDPASGAELDRRLAPHGYRAYRVGRRGLEPGLGDSTGLFNAAFVAG